MKILRTISIVTLALIFCGCKPSQDADTATLLENGALQRVPIELYPYKEGDVHPLKGQRVQLSILGFKDWFPSELAGELGQLFSAYAKEKYDYDVTVRYEGAVPGALMERAEALASTGSQDYNIIICDSQWLGLFATQGGIVNVSDLMERVPELKFNWWDDVVVTRTYMEYPLESGDLWSFPQVTDVQVLYVRKDLFDSKAEQTRFKSLYHIDLPTSFDDFADLSMTDFEKVAEFFTRPDQDLYGTAFQYSTIYDFISMQLYPFFYSTGGDVWDPKTQQIYGILNTDNNAQAMHWYRKFLQYQPADAVNYGVFENMVAFNQGKVATALQWSAMGKLMIQGLNDDHVMIVPPPGVRQKDGSLKRLYSMGGQSWVINAFNDKTQMQLCIDFLKWWYLPETQMEFARRGGNPAVKEAFDQADFYPTQLWFKTLKYMLNEERSKDFWHHPKFEELLKIQQHGFHDFMTGKNNDAKAVLDDIASRQQQILYDYGSTKIAPPKQEKRQIDK